MDEAVLKVAVRLASSIDDLSPDVKEWLSQLYIGNEDSNPRLTCRANDPKSHYVCTRTKNHDGVHVAHYSLGRLCDTLPWWD